MSFFFPGMFPKDDELLVPLRDESNALAIVYGSDLDDDQVEQQRRQDNRERTAWDYLELGTMPVIQSAALKGPFENGWENPWLQISVIQSIEEIPLESRLTSDELSEPENGNNENELNWESQSTPVEAAVESWLKDVSQPQCDNRNLVYDNMDIDSMIDEIGVKHKDLDRIAWETQMALANELGSVTREANNKRKAESGWLKMGVDKRQRDRPTLSSPSISADARRAYKPRFRHDSRDSYDYGTKTTDVHSKTANHVPLSKHVLSASIEVNSKLSKQVKAVARDSVTVEGLEPSVHSWQSMQGRVTGDADYVGHIGIVQPDSSVRRRSTRLGRPSKRLVDYDSTQDSELVLTLRRTRSSTRMSSKKKPAEAKSKQVSLEPDEDTCRLSDMSTVGTKRQRNDMLSYDDHSKSSPYSCVVSSSKLNRVNKRILEPYLRESSFRQSKKSRSDQPDDDNSAQWNSTLRYSFSSHESPASSTCSTSVPFVECQGSLGSPAPSRNPIPKGGTAETSLNEMSNQKKMDAMKHGQILRAARPYNFNDVDSPGIAQIARERDLLRRATAATRKSKETKDPKTSVRKPGLGVTLDSTHIRLGIVTKQYGTISSTELAVQDNETASPLQNEMLMPMTVQIGETNAESCNDTLANVLQHYENVQDFDSNASLSTTRLRESIRALNRSPTADVVHSQILGVMSTTAVGHSIKERPDEFSVETRTHHSSPTNIQDVNKANLRTNRHTCSNLHSQKVLQDRNLETSPRITSIQFIPDLSSPAPALKPPQKSRVEALGAPDHRKAHTGFSPVIDKPKPYDIVAKDQSPSPAINRLTIAQSPPVAVHRGQTRVEPRSQADHPIDVSTIVVVSKEMPDIALTHACTSPSICTIQGIDTRTDDGCATQGVNALSSQSTTPVQPCDSPQEVQAFQEMRAVLGATSSPKLHDVTLPQPCQFPHEATVPEDQDLVVNVASASEFATTSKTYDLGSLQLRQHAQEDDVLPMVGAILVDSFPSKASILYNTPHKQVCDMNLNSPTLSVDIDDDLDASTDHRHMQVFPQKQSPRNIQHVVEFISLKPVETSVAGKEEIPRLIVECSPERVSKQAEPCTEVNDGVRYAHSMNDQKIDLPAPLQNSPTMANHIDHNGIVETDHIAQSPWISRERSWLSNKQELLMFKPPFSQTSSNLQHNTEKSIAYDVDRALLSPVVVNTERKSPTFKSMVIMPFEQLQRAKTPESPQAKSFRDLMTPSPTERSSSRLLALGTEATNTQQIFEAAMGNANPWATPTQKVSTCRKTRKRVSFGILNSLGEGLNDVGPEKTFGPSESHTRFASPPPPPEAHRILMEEERFQGLLTATPEIQSMYRPVYNPSQHSPDSGAMAEAFLAVESEGDRAVPVAPMVRGDPDQELQSPFQILKHIPNAQVAPRAPMFYEDTRSPNHPQSSFLAAEVLSLAHASQGTSPPHSIDADSGYRLANNTESLGDVVGEMGSFLEGWDVEDELDRARKIRSGRSTEGTVTKPARSILA